MALSVPGPGGTRGDVGGPAGVHEEDTRWAASIEQWRNAVRALTGNPVETLEVGTDEAASRLTRGFVWSG